MADDSELLQGQVAYYRARAPEYDDWFFRRGRYDRGRDANARWLREVGAVEQELADFAPLGEVVELAAGTGLWTRWLASLSTSVVAVDANEEVLALNRARVNGANVEWLRADIFDWTPPRRFDEVFFAFWLSHVPPGRFEAFWRLVEDLLHPHGRFFFVGSLSTETSTATDQQLQGRDAVSVARRLNDGREFQIVKVFHEPSRLQRQLLERGWQAQVKTSGEFFLYGHGQR